MQAKQLYRQRIIVSDQAFSESVIWALPAPLAGSTHSFKYRLAYVFAGVCVLRFDNEAGKGDHCHIDGVESAYTFTTPAQLMADFFDNIQRWNHEHSHA